MKTDEKSFARGCEIRGEMFGPASLKRMEEASAFEQPLQELVTQVCFGQVWDRPELPRPVRSMITIAMLVAQSRPNELQRHVRAAIRNGVTVEQIREVLLHATLYAGIPAGTDSWAKASEALQEMGEL